MGYSPRGRKESDRTEQLTLSLWLVQGTGPGPENEVVIHVSAQLLRGVCWGWGAGGSKKQSDRWSDAVTPGDTESPAHSARDSQDPGHLLLSPGIWFLLLQ